MDKRQLIAAALADKINALMDWVDWDTAERDGPGWALRRVLESKKIKVLGNGHYGVTVLLEDGNVLKACIGDKDAYPAFAMFAHHNPMPGLPDIFYTCRIDRLFVAAMPCYRELNSADQDRVRSLRDAGREGTVGPGYLSRAVRAVVNHFSTKAREDMHLGNFMYCEAHGTYILTDPYAEVYDRDSEKLECEAVGKTYVPPIREQMDLDWNTPVKTPRAEVPNLPQFHPEMVRVVELTTRGLQMHERLVPKHERAAQIAAAQQAQVGPAGRFRMNNPQMQNLPKVRKLDALNKFADFAKVDARVMANLLCNEPMRWKLPSAMVMCDANAQPPKDPGFKLHTWAVPGVPMDIKL